MKLWVVISVLFVSLVGCSYEHIKGAAGRDGALDKSDNCGPVDFATINQRVFKKSCTGCHSPDSSIDVKGLFLTDHLSIKNNIGASIASIRAGRMPKLGVPVSQDDLDLLVAWEKQRTPEFTAEPPVQSCNQVAVVDPVKPDPVDPVDPVPTDPPVDVLEANYNSIRKHILEVKCSGCHDINQTKPKPPKYKFGTYSDMVANTVLFNPANEQSRFAIAVITGDMPVFGDLLTDDEINVVVDWIKAGLPESNVGPAALLPDVINNMTGGQP